MKVTTSPPTGFKEVYVILESQEEVDSLRELMNTTTLYKLQEYYAKESDDIPSVEVLWDMAQKLWKQLKYIDTSNTTKVE